MLLLVFDAFGSYLRIYLLDAVVYEHSRGHIHIGDKRQHGKACDTDDIPAYERGIKHHHICVLFGNYLFAEFYDIVRTRIGIIRQKIAHWDVLHSRNKEEQYKSAAYHCTADF